MSEFFSRDSPIRKHRANRSNLSLSPTRPGNTKKSSLSNEILLSDSPSKNTRSKTRTNIQFEYDDDEVPNADSEIDKEKGHIEPELVIIDYISDLPFVTTIIDGATFVIATIYVSFWGIFNVLKSLVIESKKVSLKRVFIILFLGISGLYIVLFKHRTDNISNGLTDGNYTDIMTDSLREDVLLLEDDLDTRVEEMFLLFQNKLKPINEKIKSNSDQIKELFQSDQLKFNSITEEFNERIKFLSNEMAKLHSSLENQNQELRESISQFDTNYKSKTKEITPELLQAIEFKVDEMIRKELEEFKFKKMVLKKYGPDYSLRSAGAIIIPSNTSPTYMKHSSVQQPSGYNHVLDSNLEPGNCWGMKGQSGFIEMKFARKITLGAIIVEHADPSSLYKQGIQSAPKKIHFYGVRDERKVSLGAFEFDPLDEHMKLIEVVKKVKVDGLFWKIESNWGNPDYTCIYRLAVHALGATFKKKEASTLPRIFKYIYMSLFYINQNDSGICLEVKESLFDDSAPKGPEAAVLDKQTPIDKRILIIQSEKSIFFHNTKVGQYQTMEEDEGWLPNTEERAANTQQQPRWTPSIIWNDYSQRWQDFNAPNPALKITTRSMMNCIIIALLISVSLSIFVIFAINSQSNKFNPSTGPRGSAPTEYSGPSLPVLGIVQSINSSNNVYFGVNMDWSLDDPEFFNKRLGYAASIQDVVFFMSETLELNAKVNSTGFIHDEDDVYIWTANLIKGTGAVMGITLIPMVSLEMILQSAIEKLAKKCKEINDMGIPILLRFAPDMNGILYLTKGNWHPYGQNPGLYKFVFQKIANQIRSTTNNTAMVWSPTSALGYPFVPTKYTPVSSEPRFIQLDTTNDGVLDNNDDPFSPYYPGDDYVDWVGLSIFYSGRNNIRPVNYRVLNRAFVVSPQTTATPTATITSAPSAETRPPQYELLVNDIPKIDNFPGSNSFEAQLTNTGSKYDFYDIFAKQKSKPFILSSTGAAFLKGASVAKSDEVEFKRNWFTQILNQNILDKYPLIRGLIFYDVQVDIVNTSMTKQVNPDTMVDYPFTNNDSVLSSFREMVKKLVDLGDEGGQRLTVGYVKFKKIPVGNSTNSTSV